MLAALRPQARRHVRAVSTAQFVNTSMMDAEAMMRNMLKEMEDQAGGTVEMDRTEMKDKAVHMASMAPARVSGYKRGRPLRVFSKGSTLLQDALYNKGVAFSPSERERLGLRGLLPPRYYDLKQQYDLFISQYQEVTEQVEQGHASALDQWQLLQGLKHLNRVLYYLALMENFQSMAPVVYTPTIGDICLNWGRLWVAGRHKEMYFSMKDKGEMAAMVYNYPVAEVDLIVVTDGSRVLGLGDLGVNGAGICIGKMDLYIAGAGFYPSRILPACLDLGTDNEELREDPFYLGTPAPKPKGEEYYAYVDEFIQAMRRRYPYALIHFEDFETERARELLRRYRHNSFVFNDDIQGTAAVTLAAFLGYVRASGVPLRDLRILCAGAGSAALGILELTAKYIARETGVSEEVAKGNFFVMDVKGLIGKKRRNMGAEAEFATEAEDGLGLMESVKLCKPHILFGCSTVGGLFTDEVLQEVATHTEHPLVMPLSNPTSKAECTIEAVVQCTEGRGIFASGSPFQDTETPAGGLTYANQCNNAFVFPGIAMGATLSGATRVNDEMLMAAAKRLSECVSDTEVAMGKLFPRVENIRGVTEHVTAACAISAIETGVATGGGRGIDWTADDLAAQVRPFMWEPDYVTYIDSTWQPQHEM
mmetsp:Transcript_51478/g.135896  ORF Transcript_51478/g.135896 Transcript_51478/m.135896 type:complete len:648 (+) Transcript_51478:24-1967(+)